MSKDAPVVPIRRQNIVEDSITAFVQRNTVPFHRPFRVEFSNSEGGKVLFIKKCTIIIFSFLSFLLSAINEMNPFFYFIFCSKNNSGFIKFVEVILYFMFPFDVAPHYLFCVFIYI